jgi:hypothetical protein
MSGSPKWSLSLSFPNQNPVYAFLSPISVTRPTHLILDFITQTIVGEEYRSLSSSLCSYAMLCGKHTFKMLYFRGLFLSYFHFLLLPKRVRVYYWDSYSAM